MLFNTRVHRARPEGRAVAHAGCGGPCHVHLHQQLPVAANSRQSRRAHRSCNRLVCNVAVGIDLGTTSSAIAVIGQDGRPSIAQDAQGKVLIPSVVAFTRDGKVLVGQEAVAAASAVHSQVDSQAYFYSVKRLMGKMANEVAQLAAQLPYTVQAHSKGWAALSRPGTASDNAQEDARVMLPQEVSAHILRHLLERAEAQLRTEGAATQPVAQGNGASAPVAPTPLYPPLKVIQEAVITVPAHFSSAARAATIEAGLMAGLQKVQLLQEPIAAAIAYGFGTAGPACNSYDTLLVFDLGGGTLDVSLLEGWDGILEVLSTDGDDQLGGDDMTRTVAQLLLSKLCQQQLSDVDGPVRLMVTQAAEELKKRLNSQDGSGAVLDKGLSLSVQLTVSPSEGSTNATTVSLAEVEAAWEPLLASLWPPLKQLAVTTRLQFNGQLPEVAGSLSGDVSSNPEPGTGVGAGSKLQWQHQLFQGQEKSGQSKFVAPPRRLTGLVLVGAATRTAAVRHFITQLCGMQPALGADPEEVVALGAALQAGVLSGNVGWGAELTDGGYIASEHGRATGWSSDQSVEWVP